MRKQRALVNLNLRYQCRMAITKMKVFSKWRNAIKNESRTISSGGGSDLDFTHGLNSDRGGSNIISKRKEKKRALNIIEKRFYARLKSYFTVWYMYKLFMLDAWMDSLRIRKK